MLNPGNPLPAFRTTACTSIEAGKEFEDISSEQYKGRWLVLYTYPKDFTFVCPTEIVEFDRLIPALKKLGASLVGGSTDNEHSHLAWRMSEAMIKELHHPLAFISPKMAADLGLLHPTAGVALRATFIVDPAGIVRFASANEINSGRNVEEVLRVLEALQTGGLTACNWKPGQATL